MPLALRRAWPLVFLCWFGGPPEASLPVQPPGVSLSEAYLDPATGRFTAPHPGVAVRWASPRGEELSKQAGMALREAPGRTAAGGVEVELGDRFASRLVATAGEDGELAIDCLPASTPAREER